MEIKDESIDTEYSISGPSGFTIQAEEDDSWKISIEFLRIGDLSDDAEEGFMHRMNYIARAAWDNMRGNTDGY